MSLEAQGLNGHDVEAVRDVSPSHPDKLGSTLRHDEAWPSAKQHKTLDQTRNLCSGVGPPHPGGAHLAVDLG